MVDRSIDRLLEYAPMPRACAGLAVVVCSASLLVACAGKTVSKDPGYLTYLRQVFGLEPEKL